MNNIDTIQEFIKEQEHLKLNTDWVLWMLDLLRTKETINPQWLRSSKHITGVTLIQHPSLPQDNEPPMI